jgi:thioredoxin-related protein
MKNIVKSAWLLAFVAITGLACAQHPAPGGDMVLAPAKGGKHINWMSFEQAAALNKKQPKKIFIDVYTGWCGWCKRMDATTFQNPVIIEYINKEYYAVKLDAETPDSIHFQDKVFVYKPENKANELAVSLLGGKMGYPTSVYLDEKFGMLSPVSGYMDAATLEVVLKYFGGNAYKKDIKFEDYKKTFKGEVQP